MKLFEEGVAEVALKALHLSSHKVQFKGLGTLRIMANKQSECRKKKIQTHIYRTYVQWSK